MTTPRFSCKTGPMAGISRVLIIVLLFASTVASAWAKDSAPQWLRDAAQTPVPTHDDDAVAVILLDDTETTVRDNGNIETLHRRVLRILRPEARQEFGGISVDFDADTKVLLLHAWTITPDGHDIAVSEKDAVEHGFLDNLEFTDVRVKSLQFAETNPGSVIGYEYAQQDRPYIFEDAWRFQHTVPVTKARFDLRIPSGWEFTAKWFNYPEQAPQAGSNEWVWELDDVPGMRLERDMPPSQAVAGWVGIKYFPRDPTLRAKSAGSWSDVGSWFNGLTQSRRDSNSAIHQKVSELTAGISDPMAQMRVLTDYVQQNIRYFAVEIGIGGYQPHSASQIFANQFGDCKDKATLLSAMLKEIGIDSYYVAVDDYREGVQPDYPSPHFNHMILAIHLPANLNDGSLFALVQDPKLGKLLIFDPTNEYVPLGYIPYYLQNTYGLVMGPDGGTLISLPLLPPATNRTLRTAQLSLNTSGILSGEVKELLWGDPAHESRQEFLETQPAKRLDLLDGFLQDYLPSFVLSGVTLGNLDKRDDVFSINYTFVSQGYARAAGDELLLRPRVLGNKDLNLLDLFSQDKPRQYPIEFDAATRRDDVFDIALPAGYSLDGAVAPVKIACDAATYSSTLEVKDGVLHSVRTLEIRQVYVPADKLSEMKDFLQKVAADQQMYVALRPGPTQPVASR